MKLFDLFDKRFSKSQADMEKNYPEYLNTPFIDLIRERNQELTHSFKTLADARISELLDDLKTIPTKEAQLAMIDLSISSLKVEIKNLGCEPMLKLFSYTFNDAFAKHKAVKVILKAISPSRTNDHQNAEPDLPNSHYDDTYYQWILRVLNRIAKRFMPPEEAEEIEIILKLVETTMMRPETPPFAILNTFESHRILQKLIELRDWIEENGCIRANSVINSMLQDEKTTQGTLGSKNLIYIEKPFRTTSDNLTRLTSGQTTLLFFLLKKSEVFYDVSSGRKLTAKDVGNAIQILTGYTGARTSRDFTSVEQKEDEYSSKESWVQETDLIAVDRAIATIQVELKSLKKNLGY